ncbi:MAG: class I SAM-dependent methyltransferase [Elusimicrobiota bacterium]
MNAGPACPLCGAESPKTFVRDWREYKLYDCPDCGGGFCEPFKNPGPEYYEHNKAVYSLAVIETTDDASFEYDEALSALARSAPPRARLLDVGCGAGGFLHRARAAGFSVAGLDFNSDRVAALRDRGFDVFAGGLPEYALAAPPASFDAITMFELIEHLDAPARWLDAAKTLLKPGGLLIVGTPNRDRAFEPYAGPGLEEIDNPPHHLTRWNAAALSGLLTRRGFVMEECRDLGYPPAVVQLLLRNSMRMGLAVRSLEPAASSAASAPADPKPFAPLVKSLVALKIAALNAAASAAYPFFRATAAARGWGGLTLFAVARKPS